MGCGSSAKSKYETKEDGKAASEEKKDDKGATEQAKGTTEKQGDGTAAATPATAAGAATPATADASKKPGETPAETKPAETKPAETTPAETKPAEKKTTVEEPKKDEEDEEEDDEEDEMDDEAFEKMMNSKGRKSRAALSAEGVEKDADWEAPVFEKTEEQKARLEASLANCFMFHCLEPEALHTVVAAFQEIKVETGQTVIKEGAEVNSTEPALYVIESGKLSVFKNGIEASVFTYTNPGQYFGDLAVLYNAPRAATVVADEESLLWSIDRNTFNFLVKDAAKESTQRRMEFLNSVELLKGVHVDEKATICEALQVRLVKKDDQIIKEGEVGAEFYIIESGACVAKKGDQVVFEYKAANYFGELALLKGAPRAADVFAVEDTKLLVLGADSFKRLLGPLEDLMKARMGEFEGVNLEELMGPPV